MPNWQEVKYVSLIALQYDAAKNSLWCLAAVNIIRKNSSATTHNKVKAHVPMRSHKRPHGNIGEIIHGNPNSFGGNGSKGAFGSKST